MPLKRQLAAVHVCSIVVGLGARGDRRTRRAAGRRDEPACNAAASALRDADEELRTAALAASQGMGASVLPALTRINRQHYPGQILEENTAAGRATVRIGLALPDDGYVCGGYGDYVVELSRNADGRMTGRFRGRYDLTPREGPAGVECSEGAAAAPDRLAVAQGVHPRTFFVPDDLPILRARARTEPGPKIIAVLLERIAREKACDWREKVNAVGYAGELR
jgi:hypothetical protein